MLRKLLRRFDFRKKKGFLANTSHQQEFLKIVENTVYGKDKSGKIHYKFNNLGYRGDWYNPKAKKLIYIAGSSSTFGTGIEWKHTYGFQFKKMYAKKFGYQNPDVNLMNFSVGAASNSYLVRTLITQCNYKKPDVLICNFAPKHFLEYKSPEETGTYCPFVDAHDLEDTQNLFFNELNLFVETVKNMLLLQYYCQVNKIKYVFAWIQRQKMKEFFGLVENTHRFLKEELDLKHFLDHSIWEIKVDMAEDTPNPHGGPATNRKYAEMLMKRFIKLYY